MSEKRVRIQRNIANALLTENIDLSPVIDIILLN